MDKEETQEPKTEQGIDLDFSLEIPDVFENLKLDLDELEI